jgi:hypothetical protein
MTGRGLVGAQILGQGMADLGDRYSREKMQTQSEKAAADRQKSEQQWMSDEDKLKHGWTLEEIAAEHQAKVDMLNGLLGLNGDSASTPGMTSETSPYGSYGGPAPGLKPGFGAPVSTPLTMGSMAPPASIPVNPAVGLIPPPTATPRPAMLGMGSPLVPGSLSPNFQSGADTPISPGFKVPSGTGAPTPLVKPDFRLGMEKPVQIGKPSGGGLDIAKALAAVPSLGGKAALAEALMPLLTDKITKKFTGADEMENGSIAASHYVIDNIDRWLDMDPKAIRKEISDYSSKAEGSDKFKMALYQSAVGFAGLPDVGYETAFDKQQRAWSEKQAEITDAEKSVLDAFQNGVSFEDLDSAHKWEAGTSKGIFDQWVKNQLTLNSFGGGGGGHRSSKKTGPSKTTFGGKFSTQAWVGAGDRRRSIMVKLGDKTDPSQTLTEAGVNQAGWDEYWGRVSKLKNGEDVDLSDLSEEEQAAIMADASGEEG